MLARSGGLATPDVNPAFTDWLVNWCSIHTLQRESMRRRMVSSATPATKASKAARVRITRVSTLRLEMTRSNICMR